MTYDIYFKVEYDLNRFKNSKTFFGDERASAEICGFKICKGVRMEVCLHVY